MPQLAIIDQDRQFAQALERQMSLLLPSMDIRVYQAADLNRAVSRGRVPDYLIRDPRLRFEPALENCLSQQPVLWRVPQKARCRDNEIVAGDSCRSIWKRLCEQQVQQRRPPLLVCHAFDANKRQTFIRHYLQAARTAGLELYYLPLVPGYELELPLHFHPGEGLENWFLRARNQAAQREGLGPYLERQAIGAYVFRPGSANFNPASADSSLLLRLAREFQAFLQEQGPKVYGLVELAQLPLPALRAWAASGEVFFYEKPRRQGYAAESSSRILSRLLNELPRNLPHFCLSEPIPAPYTPARILQRHQA